MVVFSKQQAKHDTKQAALAPDMFGFMYLQIEYLELSGEDWSFLLRSNMILKLDLILQCTLYEL